MFSISEILKATRGKLLKGPATLRVKDISIDSRAIRKDDLFIAIKGKKYDGHIFMPDAIKKGACGVLMCSTHRLTPAFKKLVSRAGCFIISVADTLKALGQIAHFHRMRFDIPVVAVTGSNGKTTTKEMIGNILRDKWAPLKNPGTQNNLVGVPLTLLGLAARYKSAVIEFGMNSPGEIKALAEMAQPNIGLVTNVGPAHLEYLDNLQAVYSAKRELLDFLGKGDIALLNNDNLFLRRFKKRSLKIFTFGINTKSDFRATSIKKEGEGWRFTVNGTPYFIPLHAYHDIYNALTAIAVGMVFNVNTEDIKRELKSHIPLEKRMVKMVFNGMEFIDDTYNSNPISMESAIRTLEGLRVKGRKILVSGDMLELGKKAVYYHNRIGRRLADSGIDNFIGVGELMRNSYLAAKRGGMKNAWFYPSKEEAVTLLKDIVRPDDVVLVKGSRAMQMEEVIKCFTTSFIP